MSERLFLDTNVVFDLLGERKLFYFQAARIATLSDLGKIELLVSALSYANIFYSLSKFEDKEVVKDKIRKFKALAETVDLTDLIVDKGLGSSFSDFEDSLQYYSAIQKNCDLIITRNGKDFKHSTIPVMSPDEYLKSRNH